MKNCNLKPLQIIAEGNQTLLPQQTTTVNAIVITTNLNDVTGAVQPLPQFDETATVIVAPALATAHNKRLNIRIANLTDFPHTIKNHTKLAELQILKPEDTKQIRPVDAAALKLLDDPDDAHLYINELLKAKRNWTKWWEPLVPHPRKPRKRRRAYANPTTNREGNPWTYQERRTRSNKASRKKFLDMF